MAPSVDRDTSPVWSPDGRSIAYLRRPGLPFGAFATPPRDLPAERVPAGFIEAMFQGGYTLANWVADVETGKARELWHNAPGAARFEDVRDIRWSGDHIVFQAEPDNWIHMYTVSVANPQPAPVDLTPGDAEVEHVALSSRWTLALLHVQPRRPRAPRAVARGGRGRPCRAAHARRGPGVLPRDQRHGRSRGAAPVGLERAADGGGAPIQRRHVPPDRDRAAGRLSHRRHVEPQIVETDRPDVDPERLGVWGLSYGGWLTGQALSHNSDLFKAGMIFAGVQMRSASMDPSNLAYQSSPAYNIDKWTSPVLIVHGDDDRNVEFSQTVGLVQALRAHNVPHEVIVNPNDTHYSQLYSRWMEAWPAIDEWFDRTLLKGKGAGPTQSQQR